MTSSPDPRPGCAARGPSRRDVLALGVGAFVALSVPVALRRRGRPLARRTIPIMGTLADLAVVHDDPHVAEAALEDAIAALRRVESTMSRFDPRSDVGRANLGATREAVFVGDETALVLREAIRWAEGSRGAFDPCLLEATEAWDVEHRAAPPPAEAWKPLAGRGLWRALDVDTWRGRPAVRLTDRAARIDLGGIAKGYGVDRAAAAIRRRGARGALVNVGGDLVAIGGSEDGDPWCIGIQDPNDPDGLVGRLEVRDEAVATSGDYERGFTYAGRRYHHLLDPATAAPRQAAFHSVTIVAPTCLAADAAATAAFVLPSDVARRDALRLAPGARVASVV